MSVVGSKRHRNDGWSPGSMTSPSETNTRSNFPRSACRAISWMTDRSLLLVAAPSYRHPAEWLPVPSTNTPKCISRRTAPMGITSSPRFVTALSSKRYHSQGERLISRSPSRDLDVEQRRVLLRAEEVALAHAPAGLQAADRELDRVGGLEDDEGRHARLVDAEEPGDLRPVERAAVTHPLEVLPVATDDVEGDVVDAGVFAADGRGELDQLHGRISSRRVRKSSRGSATSIAWFSVHSYAGRAWSTSSDMIAAVPAVPFTSGRRA